jgi:hypothetical protein
MNPLESAILKANWAHVHWHILDDEVTKFLKSNRYGIPAELDWVHSRYIFRTNVGKSVINEWGLRVGDIVTNMKDSLDHIAYRLVSKGNRSVRERIYFPLFKHRNEWDSAKWIRHFSPEAIAELERLQPYHAPEGSVTHPLWAISELARIDKHRYINIMPMMASIPDSHTPLDGTFSLSFDETGLVGIISNVPQIQEDVNLYVAFEPQIEISEPDLIYHFNLGVLHDAYTMLATTVIPAFSCLLPETMEEL